MVLESGLLQEREERYELTGPLPPLAIPATLHDSLMARLDRLATVKGLAQLGATLGREFSYELLQAVSPWDEETLQRGLAPVGGGGVPVPAGAAAAGDVPLQACPDPGHAYQSLLRSTRQQYHQRIAQVLEARFPEICETQPELLAHHYTEAGLNAGHSLLAAGGPAGHRALGQSGSDQASHQGLEVLKTLPDTLSACPAGTHAADRPGAALMATKGLAAPGSGTRLRPGARAMPAGGRDPAALPGAVGLWVLFRCGEVPDGAELGSSSSPWPSVQVKRPPRGGPSGAGGPLFLLGELALPEHTWSRGWPSTIPSSTAPMASSMGRTRG